MFHADQLDQVTGSTAYTSDGEKLGKVSKVFLDDQTGEPSFVSVGTGLFGRSDSFLPAYDATMGDEGLRVPFTKQQVKDAPTVDASEGHLDSGAEHRLLDYYRGIQAAARGEEYLPPVRTTASRPDEVSERSTPPAGASPATPTSAQEQEHASEDRGGGSGAAEDGYTLTEEQLAVDTETRPTERVRVRKYVVTEEETYTVQVRKERVAIEREPLTPDDPDSGGGHTDDAGTDWTEQSFEVVLHEEQVVVEKKVVPVERVKVSTETLVEDQTVTESVRKDRLGGA